MKLIVNSKYFAAQIKTILEKDCKTVFLANRILHFANETIDHNFDVHVKESSSETFIIDRIMWYRAMKFLNSMQEQPVSIEIEYDWIDVYGVSRFKGYKEV